MRFLLAIYPDGHVEFWIPEMQETLENLPDSERPKLSNVSWPISEVSAPELV